MLYCIKKGIGLLMAATIAVSIIGCGHAKPEEKASAVDEKVNVTETELSEVESEGGEVTEPIVYEKDFGTYQVDQEWTEIEDGGLFVYMREGTEDDETADSFVVGYSENPYTLDQISEFQSSIEAQLTDGLSQYDDSELIKAEYETLQGYPLLIFSFNVEDEVITQYYIIGEKKHCMIQTMIYGDSEEGDRFVGDVVNSFTWSE